MIFHLCHIFTRILAEPEIVAAGLLGRSRSTGDGETLQVGLGFGEETELDSLGEVDFRLPLDDAPFRISLLDEPGDPTGDALEHLQQ